MYIFMYPSLLTIHEIRLSYDVLYTFPIRIAKDTCVLYTFPYGIAKDTCVLYTFPYGIAKDTCVLYTLPYGIAMNVLYTCMYMYIPLRNSQGYVVHIPLQNSQGYIYCVHVFTDSKQHKGKNN